MNKLKSIIDPGHKKDDAVLYGDGNRDNVIDASTGGQQSGLTQQSAYAGPEGHKDGLKWDTVHQRYEPLGSETTEKHGLLGLGSKHPNDTQRSHLDDRIDSPMTATHPHTDPTRDQPSSSLSSRPVMVADNDTNASIKSGVQGLPPRSKNITDSMTPTQQPTSGTTTTLPYVSGQTSGVSGAGHEGYPTSNAGYTDSNTNKGGVLGSAKTALGLGHNTHEHDYPHEGGREFPLSGGTTGATTVGAPHTSTRLNNNDVGRSSTAVVGDPFGDHQHKGHRHNYEGDPCEHGAAEPAPPLLTAGPHATDTANRLDPHVSSARGGLPPADFPSGTGVSTSGATTSVGHSDTRSEDRSHLGRDAALTGVAGGAGLGALGASSTMPHGTTTSVTSALPHGSHQTPYSSTAVDPRLDSTVHTGPTSTYDAQRADPALHRDHQRVGDGVTAGTAGLVGVVAGSEFSKRQAERDAKHDQHLTNEPRSHHGDSLHDDGTEKKRGGLMGLLHRDKDHGAEHVEPHATHDRHHGTAPVSTTHATHDRHHGAAPVSATHAPRDHHHATEPASTTGFHGTDMGAAPVTTTGFRGVDPGTEEPPIGLARRTEAPTGHVHDRDTTDHGKEKKGGLLGMLHSDKDKTPAHTEPYTTHDRHHGTVPLAATTAAPLHHQTHGTEPVTGHRAHDNDTLDQGKEKKSGGLLGFVHGDQYGTAQQGTQPVVPAGGTVGSSGPVHDRSRETAPVIGHTTHDTTTDHEKKKGGLLGFLHSDKDKTHDQHVPEHDRHYKTGAVAGAGAVGAGAVAYDEARERELARERDARAKEIAHEQAAREKELAKERAAHDKHVAKEHDKHHTTHDKDADKEKKGGLLGFLHRDKDKDAHEPEPVHDRHHRQDPTVTGATTGTTALASEPHHDKHERNRLHKDPPPGYYEEMAAKRANEHQGTEGSLNEPQSGSGLTNTTGYDTQRAPGQIVTEPHTGLPMDVGKGDGFGGTDADPTIEGYGQHSQRHQQL